MNYEKAYKNYAGEWSPSQWKDGRIYETHDDTHTYGRDGEGIIYHDNCFCLNITKI
jgi:hypothetical protein